MLAFSGLTSTTKSTDARRAPSTFSLTVTSRQIQWDWHFLDWLQRQSRRTPEGLRRPFRWQSHRDKFNQEIPTRHIQAFQGPFSISGVVAAKALFIDNRDTWHKLVTMHFVLSRIADFWILTSENSLFQTHEFVCSLFRRYKGFSSTGREGGGWQRR